MGSYIICLVSLAALVSGCGKKREEAAPPPADPVPVRCPAGSVIENGACVAVVTAAKVQVVEQQKARLDELAQLLARSEVITAPAALLDDVRQSELWKKLAARSSQLASADELMASLGVAAAQLRGLKEQLGEASASLTELERELQTVMVEGDRAQQLADVQERVSRKMRELVGPLQRQVKTTVEKVGGPLAEQLGALGDKINGACTVSKVTGGSDALQAACGKAKDAFGGAVAFLVEVKDKPAALFQDVTGTLERELGSLVDEETRSAVDRAQTSVKAAAEREPHQPSQPVGTSSGGGGAAASGGGAAASGGGGAAASGGGLVSALGQPCGAGDACPSGATCKTYYGFAGPSGPAFKSCEVPCGAAASGAVCPAGTACVTVADGPGAVCRAP